MRFLANCRRRCQLLPCVEWRLITTGARQCRGPPRSMQRSERESPPEPGTRTRDKEAEALHREALEIRRRVLGPEHPDTLTSMNNLALSYSGQGRYKEAEVMYQEALEIRKRVLGPEHLDTLWSMTDLATSYIDQGRYKEAEVMDREVVENSKRFLGPEHPDTLTYMGSLGNDLYYLDRPAREAKELFVELLEIQSRVLGPEHPRSLQTMYNLARTMLRLGDLAEAEQLARKNLEIRRPRRA